MKRAMKMIGTLAIVLAIALITPRMARAQSVAQPNEVGEFIHNLVGEWIGTYAQTTDGKNADTKKLPCSDQAVRP